LVEFRLLISVCEAWQWSGMHLSASVYYVSFRR